MLTFIIVCKELVERYAVINCSILQLSLIDFYDLALAFLIVLFCKVFLNHVLEFSLRFDLSFSVNIWEVVS